jgi:hypothetical protein
MVSLRYVTGDFGIVTLLLAEGPSGAEEIYSYATAR